MDRKCSPLEIETHLIFNKTCGGGSTKHGL